MATGNDYTLWCINTKSQVVAIDQNGTSTSKSEVNFASQIGISEDGTVWVLSRESDPDGGGAKIFWSTGDETWNEISTSDPGGINICGYINSECLYQTSGGAIFRLDTNGAASHYYNVPEEMITSFDYGGGYFWANVMKDGKPPQLSYTPVTQLNLQPISDEIAPISFSVNNQGNCLVLLNGDPFYYPSDGGKSWAFGTGVDGMGMTCTSKTWSYILSSEANMEGNKILKWVDQQGGIWQDTGWRAYKIATSYHRYS